jgi:acyl-CoA reductase-like NAD-dependent aldehyde dehydrogenase
MGPLVDARQQQSAQHGFSVLKQEADVIFGQSGDFAPLGDNVDNGSFFQPTLFRCDKPLEASRIHDTEVFGPVATVMPYQREPGVWELAERGGGSLAGSVFSNDDDFAARATLALAPTHGRLLVTELIARSHRSWNRDAAMRTRRARSGRWW